MIRVLLAVLLVAGCGSGIRAPETPVYHLLLPAGDFFWKDDLVRGFVAGCEQFDMVHEVHEYSGGDAESIVEVARSVKDPKGAPITIVFLSREPIAEVATQLLVQDRVIITLGEDNASSSRIGHVGDASERLAYFFSIRWDQMDPKPQNVLFVFGRVPLTRDRITGALFARSDDWRRFKLRFRSMEELSGEDVAWADLTLPIGQDALSLVKRMRASPIVPVDGSDEALSLLESGEANYAIAPSYFQMGFRATRIAREYFLGGFLQNPTIFLPYREISPETVEWERNRRYELPPAVPNAK